MEETGRATVLIVDDDPEMLESLRKVLTRHGYSVLAAGGGSEGVQVLRERSVDLVLTDLRMPSIGGMSLLKISRTIAPHVQVIIITAYGTVGRAVEALRSGASSFILKPFKVATLIDAVESALQRRCVEIDQMCGSVPPELPGVVGHSQALRDIADMVARAAPSTAAVLIEGESGTGKEVIADALHRLSGRHERPMIKVNCAALPENLLEAELFGPEKGAFTGAISSRRGRFELADGGTIFLDEISTLRPSAQAKLLRILQNGEMERLGSSQTVRVDVRLISATNAPLEAALANGAFRGDLYYRLNVIRIHVPPLRHRADDIPPLAEHFIRTYSEKNHKDISGITRQAMDMLRRYGWPGNVRELQHALERAVVLARSNVIGVDDLPEALRTRQAIANDMVIPIGTTMRDVQRRIIEETLKYTEGDRSAAAGLLGIAPRTVTRHIKDNHEPPA